MGDSRRFPFAEHRDADVWSTLNDGLRSVKTWWRSRAGEVSSGRVVDLTGDTDLPDDTFDRDELITATRDAVVESLGKELERLRRELNTRDADLVRALERLADGHERVVERLDEDRRQQRMLADALIRLERRLPPAEPRNAITESFAGPSQVVGGTIIPSLEPPVGHNGNGRESPASRVQPTTETPDDQAPDDQPSS